MRRFDSSLRWQLQQRLDSLGKTDLLVGIPCYNSEETIAHVVTMVGRGLAEHFGNSKGAILISDGGSLDDARERAYEAKIPTTVERRVAIYYRVWNRNRRRLVDMLVPLYFGRLADYCRAVADIEDEREVEKLIERQAAAFEEERPYLLERWN